MALQTVLMGSPWSWLEKIETIASILSQLYFINENSFFRVSIEKYLEPI